MNCPYCNLNPYGIEGSSAIDCCEYGYALFGLKLPREVVDKAAEQGLHLTGGSLPAQQALSKPEVSSAPKQNPIPPTRK